MKQVLIVSFALVWLILTFNLEAYQHSFINLISPTELGDWDGEATISHRFRGKIDDEPLDTFFGMDRGANIGLSYRQAFLYRAELKLGYIRDDKENLIQASWAFTPVDLLVQAQLDIQRFSYETYSFVYNDIARRKNFLFILSAQNEPIAKRLILNINAGYEAENERFVTGLGAGVITLPNLTVLGEYYPVLDRDSAPDDVQSLLRKHDSFSIGIKADTYGHHFTLFLGNSDGITLRTLSKGHLDKNFKFGFNVQRHFDF